MLYNKYYVDQIYDAMFVNRTKDLATTLGAFDRGMINGLGVDGAGWLTRTLSSISMVWDKWMIDGMVNLVARIVWILSYPVRMMQSGRVCELRAADRAGRAADFRWLLPGGIAADEGIDS